MRLRAEKTERSFAHSLESGGLRRINLRGLENIRKRHIVHVANFKLGIAIRKLFGVETPRGMAGLKGLVRACLQLLEKAMAGSGRIGSSEHDFCELVGTCGMKLAVTPKRHFCNERLTGATGFRVE